MHKFEKRTTPSYVVFFDVRAVRTGPKWRTNRIITIKPNKYVSKNTCGAHILSAPCVRARCTSGVRSCKMRVARTNGGCRLPYVDDSSYQHDAGSSFPAVIVSALWEPTDKRGGTVLLKFQFCKFWLLFLYWSDTIEAITSATNSFRTSQKLKYLHFIFPYISKLNILQGLTLSHYGVRDGSLVTTTSGGAKHFFCGRGSRRHNFYPLVI